MTVVSGDQTAESRTGLFNNGHHAGARGSKRLLAFVAVLSMIVAALVPQPAKAAGSTVPVGDTYVYDDYTYSNVSHYIELAAEVKSAGTVNRVTHTIQNTGRSSFIKSYQIVLVRSGQQVLLKQYFPSADGAVAEFLTPSTWAVNNTYTFDQSFSDTEVQPGDVIYISYQTYMDTTVSSPAPIQLYGTSSEGSTTDPGTDPTPGGSEGGSGLGTGSGELIDGWREPSNANPGFPAQCGLRIALVADLSSSLAYAQRDSAGRDAYEQMTAAAHNFIDTLENTDVELGLYNFATRAPADGSAEGLGVSNEVETEKSFGTTYHDEVPYYSLSDDNNVEYLKSVADQWRNGSGATNWKEGLEQLEDQGYDVVYFITDGAPTTAYPEQYTGQYNLGGWTDVGDLNEAIKVANRLKDAGTRIETIGIDVKTAGGTYANETVRVMNNVYQMPMNSPSTGIQLSGYDYYYRGNLEPNSYYWFAFYYDQANGNMNSLVSTRAYYWDYDRGQLAADTQQGYGSTIVEPYAYMLDDQYRSQSNAFVFRTDANGNLVGRDGRSYGSGTNVTTKISVAGGVASSLNQNFNWARSVDQTRSFEGGPWYVADYARTNMLIDISGQDATIRLDNYGELEGRLQEIAESIQENCYVEPEGTPAISKQAITTVDELDQLGVTSDAERVFWRIDSRNVGETRLSSLGITDTFDSAKLDDFRIEKIDTHGISGLSCVSSQAVGTSYSLSNTPTMSIRCGEYPAHNTEDPQVTIVVSAKVKEN